MPEDSAPSTSLAGHLLIATPALRDPNFFRSVVLIVRHNDEGALGLILNRPGPMSVQEMWSKLGGTSCQREEPIYFGGPIQGPVSVIHGEEQLADYPVLPGVFFSADKEYLEDLITAAERRLKTFLGYSGWGAGQLEGELKQNAWLTAPATAEHVFGNDPNLWESLTKAIARRRLASTLRIKHVPQDPNWN